MNATTRHGRREGAAALAQWKDDGFTSVEACLHKREQVYVDEKRRLEHYKTMPKTRRLAALLREQEYYLDGLLAGARTMAERLKRDE